MFIQRSTAGLAIMSPLPPEDTETYWEVDELPLGDGPLYVTEDGQLYRGVVETPQEFVNPHNNSSNELVDALLN